MIRIWSQKKETSMLSIGGCGGLARRIELSKRTVIGKIAEMAHLTEVYELCGCYMSFKVTRQTRSL